MPTPIFPGHFQPWHNGHMMVVKGMVRAHGTAIIVICENQTSVDNPDGERRDATDSPFTTEERREMISEALLDEDMLDVTIATVKHDVGHAGFVDEVLEAADRPSDAVIWSGNEHVLKAFEKHGIKTQRVSPVPGISAADIRQHIAHGDPAWEKKVPSSIVAVIRNAMNH